MEAVLVGLGGHRRQPASEAICGLGQERVSQPGIGVVDQDLDRPQRGLGAIEQFRNSRWVRQIRCPRGCPTTCSLDRLRDRLASLRTGYGVARETSGLHTGIIGPQAQVGKKDGHTLVGECACRGGPDSLVGAGHDGHPSLDAWVDHSSASFLAWCQPRRRRSCSSSSARACSAAARRSSTSCSRCSSCRARRRTSRDGSICVPSRSRTRTKGCVA